MGLQAQKGFFHKLIFKNIMIGNTNLSDMRGNLEEQSDLYFLCLQHGMLIMQILTYGFPILSAARAL